jgi:hypothetical protein
MGMGIFHGVKLSGLNLNSHLQLVPRSRKHGSIHPPPPIFLQGVVLRYLSKRKTLLILNDCLSSLDYIALNNELKSVWKETVMALFVLLFRHLPEESKQRHKEYVQ